MSPEAPGRIAANTPPPPVKRSYESTYSRSASPTGVVAVRPLPFMDHSNLPGFGIVRAHLVAAGRDELGAKFVFPNVRRRPVRFLVAIDAPDVFARLLVEGHEKRRLVVVALDVDVVAEQHRRASGAPTELHAVGAEVFRPEQIAGEVVAVNARHAEVGDHALAIGDGRFRRIRIVGVDRNRRPAFAGDLFPKSFAASPRRGRALSSDS